MEDFEPAITHTTPPNSIDPQTVLDSLAAHIAILDKEGTIVSVNRAWHHCFSRRRQGLSCVGNDGECDLEEAASGTGVGTNYLEVCRNTRGPEAKFAKAALEGLESVLEGRRNEFNLIYPCAWPVGSEGKLSVLDFLLSATRLPDGGAVVAHHEIPRHPDP